MTNPRKSARKKPNRFEELGEAVEEFKESDIVDPNSSLTGESEPSANNNNDLKTSFLEFQNRTNTQFATLEFNFRNMTDTLNSITKTLGQINSRQNSTSPHQSTPDEQDDLPSDTQTNATNDDNDEEHDYESQRTKFDQMRPILASVTPSHNHNNFETIHHNDINTHQSANTSLPLEINHTNTMTSDTSRHTYPSKNLLFFNKRTTTF